MSNVKISKFGKSKLYCMNKTNKRVCVTKQWVLSYRNPRISDEGDLGSEGWRRGVERDTEGLTTTSRRSCRSSRCPANDFQTLLKILGLLQFLLQMGVIDFWIIGFQYSIHWNKSQTVCIFKAKKYRNWDRFQNNRG